MGKNFWKILFFTVGLSAFYLTAHAKESQMFTAEDIIQRCHAEGSINLVNQITDGDGGGEVWLKIVEHIRTGDKAWIETAVCLNHGVRFGWDEWAGSALTQALTEALSKNPEAVLSLEDDGMSLRNVCSMPFTIEKDQEFVVNYMAKTLPQLDEITPRYENAGFDSAKICALRMRDAYEKEKIIRGWKDITDKN